MVVACRMVSAQACCDTPFARWALRPRDRGGVIARVPRDGIGFGRDGSEDVGDVVRMRCA